MSDNMRIRFDSEEPEPSWSGREVFHWVLKHREGYGGSTGNDNQEEGLFGRIPEENKATWR